MGNDKPQQLDPRAIVVAAITAAVCAVAVGLVGDVRGQRVTRDDLHAIELRSLEERDRITRIEERVAEIYWIVKRADTSHQEDRP